MNEDLLNVRSLTKEYINKRRIFSRKSHIFKAVDKISFSIRKGETFGLVGESGCGKSTTGKMLVRLEEPTTGKIYFKGENLTDLNEKQMQPIRRNLQMIFQNPYGSLNPKMTLKQIIEEPLKIHKLAVNNRHKRICQLLDYVGLQSAFLDRYPSEFSGGQRQRIAIARALSLHPEFIVADEPVSALDVSIQAHILNLLIDLQKEFSLTYLFISHDLSVVRYISDRAGVMYLGKIVEMADCDNLYDHPLHPYTKMLLASIPIPDPEKPFEFVTEDLPGIQVSRQKHGCAFYPRCANRIENCLLDKPELKEISPGHFAACHLYTT
ncbi:ATP-binding cassette domain-containing protein [bacterium]|nr:ATP-binding cassette domain-containing protein [bacterium]